MNNIYLDSAATTCIRPEVVTEMVRVLSNDFGNPSSTHSFGRTAKNDMETSRKTIAKLLHCSAQELIFTGSATEGTNWVLRNAVQNMGVGCIITSKMEHHATLYTVKQLEKEFGVEVLYVKHLPTGAVDMSDCVQLLMNGKKTLVSLMHVNNEIGTVLDVEKMSRLCKQHEALFHCDTVQSVGKTELNLEELQVDFMVASAHKFHGPKGIGFAFVRKGLVMQPMLYGGEQEKGLRAGTEGVHQVVGMAKALELSYLHLTEEREYIASLKAYCAEQLFATFEGIKINGSDTFYNILNILLPFSEQKTAMMLFTLDMKGIAVSRGSACQSGSMKPSHVLAEILSADDLLKPTIRVSFSHYNTKEEVDTFISVLKEI